MPGTVCSPDLACSLGASGTADRKSTRLNSSHSQISYAVFCLKKKNKTLIQAEYCLGTRKACSQQTAVACRVEPAYDINVAFVMVRQRRIGCRINMCNAERVDH